MRGKVKNVKILGNLSLVLFFSLFMFVIFGLVSAVTITINPIKDTMLVDNTTERGNDFRLIVGQFSTLLKFDLSGIPSGSTVTNATLEVYHQYISPDSGTEDLVGVWAMQKPWDLNEDGVLDTGEPTQTYQYYNTVDWESDFARGATDRGTVLATDSITGSSSEWGVWSIPVSVIQGWLDNPSTNYGFQMDGYLNTLRKTFRSKEYASTNPTLIPRLIVTYEPPEPTVSIKDCNGAPTIYKNGVAIAPLTYYMANATTNSTYTQQMAAAGVHIYTFHCDLRSYNPSDPNNDIYFENIIPQVEHVLADDPDALIFPRLYTGVPQWWADEHPDEIMEYESGLIDTTYNYCPASQLWRSFASEAVASAVQRLETSVYADHIIGYHLGGGWWGEWNNGWERGADYPDFSTPGITAFRNWLRAKYNNDVAKLQDAWDNGSVTFDNAAVPSGSLRDTTNIYNFRNPANSRQVSDYYEYFPNNIAEAIEVLAKVVKDNCGYNKLVFAFFGYSLVHHTGYSAKYPQHSGHLATQRLLQSPYIDVVCAPFDYRNRGMGGADAIHTVTDSIEFNGKMAFAENDFLIHPDNFGVPVELAKKVEVIRRNAAYTLTKNTGMWYMDLYSGQHWYDNPQILATIKRGSEILQCALNIGRSRGSKAEVAVILDEQSPLFQNLAYAPNRPLIFYQKDALHRMGVPFDVYLVEDLLKDNFPEYKLYIFSNCFYLDQQVRDAINTKVKKNKHSVVWMYASGVLSTDGYSLTKMSDLIGINIAARQDTWWDSKTRVTNNTDNYTSGLLNHEFGGGLPAPFIGGTDTAGSSDPSATTLNPLYYANDAGATTLCINVATSNPVMAVKRFSEWDSVFVGTDYLSEDILKQFCVAAGVNVYTPGKDTINAGGDFVMLHTVSSGTKIINLPQATDVYEIFRGELKGRNISNFTETSSKVGETFLYYTGDLGNMGIIYFYPVMDTMLVDNTTEYGNDQRLITGPYTSLLKFNLTNLPTGITITGATLNAYHSEYTDNAPGEIQVGLWIMQKSGTQDEDGILETGECSKTYKQYNTVSWTAPFARGTSDRGSLISTDSISYGAEWGQWSVPVASIQFWRDNPSTNYGVQLDSTDGISRRTFLSKEYAVDIGKTLHPYLAVYYTKEPAGVKQQLFLPYN